MAIRTNKEKTLCVQYDFARDGGDVGVIRLGDFFPNNSIFIDGYFFVTFETIGVGGTIQATSIDSGDGLSALFAMPFPTNQIINFSTRTIITPTSELGIEIAGAPATQGRFLLYAQYLENNDV